MNNTPSQNEALQRIRQKLYLCAHLALKNNIDLSGELFRIFGSDAPETPPEVIEAKAKTWNGINTEELSSREWLIFETVCESVAPVSINEMLVKFKNKKDTNWSRTTITGTVKILQTLNLISYTVGENKKVGYLKKQHGTIIA